MADQHKALASFGVGQAYIDDNRLFNMTEFLVTINIENVEIPRQNSVTVLPVGQTITGRAVTSDFNLALLAELTGGTTSTGSIPPVSETLTKSTNTLTLSQTPEDTNHITITPSGANSEPLKQVASAPSEGEYSVSGTTVTLNASQSETTFLCEYTYDDGSNGETITLDPDDLPSSFEVLGQVKAASLFDGGEGTVTVNLAKCRRTNAVVIGGSKNSHQAIEIEFTAENAVSGDVKITQYTP